MLNKYLLEHYNISKTLDTRIHRLLAKHKQENGLNNDTLNSSIRDLRKYEEKDTFNDVLTKGKKKKKNECSLNNIKGYEAERKDKSFVYTVGDSYFEKRKLDNIHFLDSIRGATNANIENLRKKTNNKYKMLSCLPVFLPLVIYLISYISNYNSNSGGSSSVTSIVVTVVIILILSFLILLLIAYICKKIKKNEDSLHIMNDIHDRDYSYFPSM
ncbi:Plasmodium exported protein (Pm-fam-a like), unknown function [Plasmodium malariae]|uniref:Uncharacterized protein n=1 Tax=Plasmodium malariae TaxID=5858 RepID=A0A1A8WKK6_PLAMA|nr:Plasmodium exported protein (Pm-fam-a like), unknown function [Plasmodium malariae]